MLLHLGCLSNKRTDANGASAVEYGLLVSAIAGIIVIIVFALGGLIHAQFDDTCESIANGDSSDTTVPASCT